MIQDLDECMLYLARLRSSEAVKTNVNLLVAAGSELLSEMVRLNRSDTIEDVHALNERLVAKITLFEARALHDGAETRQMMAARYVLCTVLDEAVFAKPWGNTSGWSQMSLLRRFHSDAFGGEKFFQLADRLLKKPDKHLLVLELMYLCLVLGFKGKYRSCGCGMELEGILNAMCQQIHQLRGYSSRGPDGLNYSRSGRLCILPMGLIMFFAFIFLVVMLSVFSWVLNEHRDSVLQSSLLDSTAVETVSTDAR